MKKLLSFLVLMLIALTLFVGCDTNTPTKENSGNSGTNVPVEKPEVKPEVKDADEGDVYLAINTYTALQYAQANITNLENLQINKEDSNTLEFTGCELKIPMGQQGNILKCTLVGSATQIIENNVVTLTCNLTEGTTINEAPHTISAELEITLNEKGNPTNFNVKKAIFDGVEIKGLSEFLNTMITQPESSTP